MTAPLSTKHEARLVKQALVKKKKNIHVRQAGRTLTQSQKEKFSVCEKTTDCPQTAFNTSVRVGCVPVD